MRLKITMIHHQRRRQVPRAPGAPSQKKQHIQTRFFLKFLRLKLHIFLCKLCYERSVSKTKLSKNKIFGGFAPATPYFNFTEFYVESQFQFFVNFIKIADSELFLSQKLIEIAQRWSENDPENAKKPSVSDASDALSTTSF